jgi:hypothetical protein
MPRFDRVDDARQRGRQAVRARRFRCRIDHAVAGAHGCSYRARTPRAVAIAKILACSSMTRDTYGQV